MRRTITTKRRSSRRRSGDGDDKFGRVETRLRISRSVEEREKKKEKEKKKPKKRKDGIRQTRT